MRRILEIEDHVGGAADDVFESLLPHYLLDQRRDPQIQEA
jgi:hypothetical protein